MKSIVTIIIVGFIAASALGVKLGRPVSTSSLLNDTLVDVLLNAPPRFMWGWGAGLAGYCGATSFQTNGIFWGNWVSSERVRDADGGSELLIAVNDQTAASALKFQFEEWNYQQKTPQGPNFVSWLRGHIDDGHIAAIGVYELKPDGDEDYDHIVPVIGYQYDASSGDTTGIYFNDLWSNQSRLLQVPDDITSRSGCTSDDDPEQPYTYCLPKNYDYGIAFLGNVDKNSETFRMTLIMPSWTEPDYGKEDHVNAKPVPFTISATISGLEAGVSYTVLRFDSYATLPTKSFASGPFTHKWSFVANGEEHLLSSFDTFMSNSTIFYRAVRS